jgi:hypothetical protein
MFWGEAGLGSRWKLPACLGLAVPLACAGAPPPASPPPAPVASASVAPPPPPPPPPQTQDEAHKLVIAAAACWFGGLWSEALGAKGEAKAEEDEALCHALEERIWGTEDKTHYAELRAVEAKAVADIAAKVDETTRNDSVDGPRREALVKLVTLLGDAQRELRAARRAGARVKRDIDHEPERLTEDEVDAVMPLMAHGKMEALYKLDAGDLTKEANALAILCALDHLEIGRGLPRHLKLYAVADAFQLLFGVGIPDVPEDVQKKLLPGTWLKFLVATAAAAGHPVSEKLQTPRERDMAAWTGMRQGFGDKLKEDADGIAASTELSKVVAAVTARLEAEAATPQSSDAPKTKPAAPAPTASAAPPTPPK